MEQCEKRLNQKFSPKEIKNGCLKDFLIETDYDILKAGSVYLLNFQISDVLINKLKQNTCFLNDQPWTTDNPEF